MIPSKYRVFLYLILISFSNISQAVNYYLSANGNDRNNGNSAETSWKTIERLNKQKLIAGDSVLFKRGDIFTGEIVAGNSGSKKLSIIYGAYGSGEKPIITGAIRIDNWENIKGGMVVAKLPNKVYNLFCDDKQQILARFPNRGYLKIDGGQRSNITFSDFDLSQPENYWEGSNIRFKAFEWEWRTSRVKDFSDHRITIADSSSNLFAAGWGYYFDNKFEELDTLCEWFYQDKEQKLYFIPASENVSVKHIEAGIYQNGFTVLKEVDHIGIRDLSIEMYEQNGIIAEGKNENIRVSGIIVRNISQTGIFIGPSSTGCVIDNNRMVDSNGRGILAVEPQFMKITHNQVSRIGFMPGYGISGVNGMVGIGIVNIEEDKSSESIIASNNLISHNIVDSTGYGGIRMDGANSVLEYNAISHALCYLADGSAIYCWGNGENYTYDNIIRNNIIHHVFGNGEATPSAGSSVIANGIYVDNFCHGIQVEGNVVFDLSGSGIHINSDAHDNIAQHNTIYNCSNGMSIAEWSRPNSTFANNITGNLIFCTAGYQTAIELQNWLLPYTHTLGTLSKNTYYNFFEKYFFKESYLSADKEEKVSIKYTFESWQRKLGYDKDGTAYQLTSNLAGFSNSRIYVNGDENKKTISFDTNEIVDLQGKRIFSLVLEPYSSQIVLFR